LYFDVEVFQVLLRENDYGLDDEGEEERSSDDEGGGSNEISEQHRRTETFGPSMVVEVELMAGCQGS
jgi:hypothetical protein